MTTLTIHIPDSKADFIKQLLKELDVKVETKKESKKAERKPNAETIKAMEELKTGKGKVFNSAKELFSSL
ncbi:hypothetical protein [Pedobacter sp. SL55]|uniref:hypothetical protein n=1 Tax=Pedobacter sp. SL55 TaxID=2995161 RepID=UPI0022711C5B|nr:hypothetical protein [Pedobacter sp. SL55]WAC39178.1 hypothetical protein OVA16_11205 [Pedobacter sp. SL55]